MTSSISPNIEGCIQVTTSEKELSQNDQQLVEIVMLDSNNIIVVDNIRDVKIEYMDELHFLFDEASNDPTATEGLKTIPSKTTSHERLRLAVVLTAMSTGRKLKTNADIQNLQNISYGNFHQECEQRGFLGC